VGDVVELAGKGFVGAAALSPRITSTRLLRHFAPRNDTLIPFDDGDLFPWKNIQGA
jgi:hypothetical protein